MVMESPKYEFTDTQNATIRTLASRMKWVGIFFVAIGVATGLISAFVLVKDASLTPFSMNALLFLFFAVVFLIIGIWTVNASRSFGLIVRTTGSDIENLMDALASLLRLYYMQFWLIIDGLIALIAAVLLLRGMDLL